MEIREKIEKVFQTVFEDETLHINENTCAKDIREWDSMHHITILSMLEETFQIKFDIDEIISMECVGDMFKVVESKANVQ